MALSKLHLCGLVWVAWTDFGGVGVGRRAILTQIDRKRQAPGHPRVDPVGSGESDKLYSSPKMGVTHVAVGVTVTSRLHDFSYSHQATHELSTTHTH